MENRTITAAFLPLLDASILIAAVEGGFAKAEGIRLKLVRETSWANVRDRMAIGHFDVAHMLAPMPIAANLGLTPFSNALLVPMALGLGGNAITVSNALHDEIGAPAETTDAANAGALVAAAIAARAKSGRPKLKLAVVHPHSAHNLELRYWLAASGISPDRDVEIVILPPPYMADALSSGGIDGYCVGEPWNTLAVVRKSGSMLTTKQAIWASSPEKVLGVSVKWAGNHEAELSALLRALYNAAKWSGKAENREALAAMLAKPAYLDCEPELASLALEGAARFEPFASAATFPWQSHALWFYSQMVRWSQTAHEPGNTETARKTYRPDIYRKAISTAGGIVPSANAKVEGALNRPLAAGASGGSLMLGPDGFFDGQIFDPDRIDDYISHQLKI